VKQAPDPAAVAHLAPTIVDLGVPPRDALDRLRAGAWRAVQLSATQTPLRPRELDRSALRDLLASLGRREIELAGLDAWVPAEHLADPATADRAVSALLAAVELAADLGRCPLSVRLPAADSAAEGVDAVIAHAERFGVALADHALPPRPAPGPGLGIDPAAWLAAGEDPVEGVVQHAARLVVARVCDLPDTGLRGPVGDPGGRLDVASYRAALRMAGAVAHVLDLRQWADPWAGMERARRVWDVASG
jgi:sugar phosphate isomerase/epimerase